jgi:hypothetical protein
MRAWGIFRKRREATLTWTPGLRDTNFEIVRIWIRRRGSWNKRIADVKGLSGRNPGLGRRRSPDRDTIPKR